MPVVRRRLYEASVRLALMLNEGARSRVICTSGTVGALRSNPPGPPGPNSSARIPEKLTSGPVLQVVLASSCALRAARKLGTLT